MGCEAAKDGKGQVAGEARVQALGGVGLVVFAFVLAHFTHHLCTGILTPLLPFLRDEFGLSYFMSGLLVAGFGLINGLAQFPMGRLGDRVSKKWIICVGLVGVSLMSIAVGLTTTYYQAIAFLFLMGLFGGGQHPSASSLISLHFGKETRGRVLGFNLVGGTASFFLTPIFAGLIARALGWREAFIILAIPALLVSLFFWKVVGSGAATQGVVGSGEKKEPGLGQVARIIGPIVTVAVLCQLVSFGTATFLPLYLVDKHGMEPAYAAMLAGLVFGAGVVAAPLGGVLSDRFGRKPVILTSVILTGPVLYLLTIAPFGIALVAVFAVLGLVMSSRLPAVESLIVDVVPVGQRATVLGAYFFFGLELNGVAPPIIGYLMDRLGIDGAFTVLALFAVALSIGTLLLRKRL